MFRVFTSGSIGRQRRRIKQNQCLQVLSNRSEHTILKKIGKYLLFSMEKVRVHKCKYLEVYVMGHRTF